MPVDQFRAQLQSALAGRYAIERELGRGGMATVYLARDLKHQRFVALKVLDPELGAVLGGERFLAEIRVTANLQHPNLLPLFDSGSADGLLFYVMPFVEGESLRARLDRERQLPVDEAVRIATAVAGALDHAHRRGVVHRDLKPENILLQDGQPLLADFGIALAVSNAGGNRVTQTGLSLGTPQYMSPEQATGDRVIDARTDVYSLGAVCYEMLAGEPPHAGATAQAVIAKLMTTEPRPVRVLRPSVPPHVATAVERALAKLPADRFATARELADALAGKGGVLPPASTAPGSALAEVRQLRGWRAQLLAPVPMALAAIALALAGVAAYQARAARGAPAPVVGRFTIELPADARLNPDGAWPALSPDGRYLAYTTGQGGRDSRLVLRPIGERRARVIDGTDGGGRRPFFSPDGKWIGFFSGGKLRRVAVDGGAPVDIATVASSGRGLGGVWTADDEIVYAMPGGPLMRVPAGGGTPRPLTRLDTAGREAAHVAPMLLPDGRTIAFVALLDGGGRENDFLSLVSLRGGPHRRSPHAAVAPVGLAEGRLLYHRHDDVLVAAAVDPAALAVGADVVPLTEPRDAWAMSATGTLVSAGGGGSALVVAAPGDTARLLLDGAGERFFSPRWSPDGRRIALQIGRVGAQQIWVYDVATKALSRLTADATGGTHPEWMANGTRILYRRPAGASEVWSKPVDGSAAAELLVRVPRQQVEEAVVAHRTSTVLLRAGIMQASRLLTAPLGGARAVTPFVDDTFPKRHPRLSPDERRVAYVLEEAGRPEVFASPFPVPGGRVQLSAGGGTEPLWAPDGNALYYRTGRQLVRVSLGGPAGLEVRGREVVLEGDYAQGLTHQNWDVAPDGRRFLFVRATGAGTQFEVTVNWLEEVRARLAGRR